MYKYKCHFSSDMRGGIKKSDFDKSIDRTLLFLKVYVICLVMAFFVFFYQGQKNAIQANVIATDAISEQEDTEIPQPDYVPKEEVVAPAEEPKVGDDQIVEPETPEPAVKSKVIASSENLNEINVEIYRTNFNNMELTVDKGTNVIWVNKDERSHKISCYEGPDRIYSDKSINNEESSEYKFEKAGEYLCVDAIFGIRQDIQVVENKV